MPDRRTILVVDDDHLTGELVQVALAAEGFHVFIATTGPEALALFRQHAAKTRAVLLDLWIPGMSGKAGGHGEDGETTQGPRKPPLPVGLERGE